MPNGCVKKAKVMIRRLKLSLKQWVQTSRTLAYLIIVCSTTNFLSHGTLDLHPTFLSSQLGFAPLHVTQKMVCANLHRRDYEMYFCRIYKLCARTEAVHYDLLRLCAPYLLTTDNGVMAAAFWQLW